ncbi:MAG: tetratricopeptide repeat protein [Methanocalculaceae archaeon]|jgi:tetratricopeptide (TPR) repeat protein|nr:tetratricopeptide repeat protein [Methanocalculaceae archaeon]
MRARNFTEAKTMFDRLGATTLEDRGMFRSSAAFCCEMLGDRDGALTRYAGLAENDPVGWYHRARLLESMEKYKDAADSYSVVQQSVADTDITVTVRRALCLYWDGNEKESALQLEKVLARGYANAELWYLLGIVSFLSGNKKRASSAFFEMSHFNQSNISVWYMKGCAEYLSGRYKEAIDSFARIGKLGGESSRVPSKMKWFLEEDADMQLFYSPASMDKTAMTKPEIGEVNVGLAAMQSFALLALGRYTEADKTALLVLDTAPDRLYLQLLHGKCLAALSSYQQAADVAARVIAKDSKSLVAYELYASSMMRIGRYKEAAEA